MLCNVIGIGNACNPLNSATPVPPAVPSGSDSLAYIMSSTYMAAVNGLVNETGVMN